MQSLAPITISRTSSTTTMVPPPATSPGPMKYRIEQTRSVYITTDIPPHQWDADQLNYLLDLGEKKLKPDGDESQRRIRHLTRSLPDRPIVLQPGSEPKAAEIPRPRSAMYHRTPKVDSGIRASVDPFAAWRGGGGAPLTPKRARILFYHKTDPHYGFTNFSAHPVVYDNKRYPTSEHLFQSSKFQPHRPDLAEHIRTYSDLPSVAFAEARRFNAEVRADWKSVNIQMMDLALWHKFTQHESLRKELLATDDAELIEDSDKDSFWGVGADRRGRNELGKALERLRTKLRGA